MEHHGREGEKANERKPSYERVFVVPPVVIFFACMISAERQISSFRRRHFDWLGESRKGERRKTSLSYQVLLVYGVLVCKLGCAATKLPVLRCATA
jgi:hypothetical protein